MRRVAFLVALAALLVACGRAADAPPGGAQSGKDLTPSALKYSLIQKYDPFYCDPDSYPLGRSGDAVRNDAVKWYDASDKESEEVKAILDHLGYSDRASSLTAEEKLRVYSDHKRLSHMTLTPEGDAYRFTLGAGKTKGETEEVSGTIDRTGTVHETSRKKAFYSCPICLPGSALIATPAGPVAVRDLRRDDVVYTTDSRGHRIVRPIERTVRRGVAPGHLMLRLVLSDGRAIVVSPRHPSVRGVPLGALGAGDMLDGATITVAALVASGENATYDILPAGPTGEYWANGILLGSTLSARFTRLAG